MSLKRGRVEVLCQLQRTSQPFDCAAIIEVLKGAKVGYAPNDGLKAKESHILSFAWFEKIRKTLSTTLPGKQRFKIRVLYP
ncbi:hypothetical protein [Gynuella sunshinyii]|uniref:hypothetical protein n=1 Tax=Gynuella sunshinyii TaxID=1445505 RepID=UPI0011854F69|nr:hypothetical protein [Gynuella sunshinyii]